MAAAAFQAALPRRGAQDADKWRNWQAAVLTGREGVTRDNIFRQHRLRSVEDRAADMSPSSGTLDAAVGRLADHENGGVRANFERYGRWTTKNLRPLKILGEGAFGVVHLVRHEETGELFALKQMDKSRYQQKNRQRAFTERDVLAEAHSRWCVELLATFQDSQHVYMVMEFLQGGDLIAHLQRKRRLSQAETAFYMAELIQALDTVHQCGFIHRDVKPDNVVIGASGHLKLLDFGLCKSDPGLVLASGSSDRPFVVLGEQRDNQRESGGPTLLATAARSRRQQLHSIVGTPQYMAPEGFRGSFSPESDLWAVGIIAFECLAGVVPFHAGRQMGRDAVRMIRDKVLRHEELFPEKLAKAKRLGFATPVAEEFLNSLVCERHERLRAEQLRRLPIFSGLDFRTLHLAVPPFVPQVASPDDTSCFDDLFNHRCSHLPEAEPRMAWDRHLEWAHYEVDGRAVEAQKPWVMSLFQEGGGDRDFTQQVFDI